MLRMIVTVGTIEVEGTTAGTVTEGSDVVNDDATQPGVAGSANEPYQLVVLRLKLWHVYPGNRLRSFLWQFFPSGSMSTPTRNPMYPSGTTHSYKPTGSGIFHSILSMAKGSGASIPTVPPGTTLEPWNRIIQSLLSIFWDRLFKINGRFRLHSLLIFYRHRSTKIDCAFQHFTLPVFWNRLFEIGVTFG